MVQFALTQVVRKSWYGVSAQVQLVSKTLGHEATPVLKAEMTQSVCAIHTSGQWIHISKGRDLVFSEGTSHLQYTQALWSIDPLPQVQGLPNTQGK